MAKDYEVTIDNYSFEEDRQLTKRDIVYIKTADFEKINDIVKEKGKLLLHPTGYAELSIHNDRVKNGNSDYKSYVVFATEGDYVTSSANLFETFQDIFADMVGEPDFAIEIFSRPSKNFTGDYLTCKLV